MDASPLHTAELLDLAAHRWTDRAYLIDGRKTLTFGDAALQFAFDPVTLAVRSVTAHHGSRTQGFVLGEPRSLSPLPVGRRVRNRDKE